MGGGRGGFTLIELLTVVAVLAVLASMLLPATAAAREAARRATCAGQLRDIGTAMTAYVVANKGFHPPYGSSRTSRVRNYLLASLPAREDWTGLWAGGQLPTVHELFCPSTRSPAHQFATPANPWPPPAGGTVRTGYSRRFLPTDRTDGLTHTSRVPSGAALAADLLVSPSYLKYQHQWGINVLHGDGAVEFHADVADLFAAAGVGASQTPSNAQLDAVWAGLDRGPPR